MQVHTETIEKILVSHLGNSAGFGLFKQAEGMYADSENNVFLRICDKSSELAEYSVTASFRSGANTEQTRERYAALSKAISAI